MRQSRRVQAQRKFAQGAFIPPAASAPIPVPERREPIATGSQVFTNNMSARNLLDIISFKNLHNHKQPVVIVERLKGNTLDDQIKKNTQTNQQQRRTQAPRIKKAESKVKRLHVMTLRERKKARKPQVKTRKVAKAKKRKSNKSPDFSLDDNRPLKYFAKCSTPLPKETAATTIENMPPPSAVGYYGEQEIHRWMNESTSIDPTPSVQLTDDIILLYNVSENGATEQSGPSRALSPMADPPQTSTPGPSQVLPRVSGLSKGLPPKPIPPRAFSLMPRALSPVPGPSKTLPSAPNVRSYNNVAPNQTTNYNMVQEDGYEEDNSLTAETLKNFVKTILADSVENLEIAQVWRAPIFRPTKEEFVDPISYFERIMPTAARYGICKIVAPEGFKPKCNLDEDIRFNVSNQYVSRLFNRWGPAARELSAIKLCLHEQNMIFNRPPLLDGVEVNLPKLYHIVQQNKGLQNVINKKRWGKVAEEMTNKGPHTEKRLDQIYFKYLLPYDTLSHEERQNTMKKVEKCWNRKYQRLLDRASNPLHRKKRLLCESESSEDETEDEGVSPALTEAEDCVVPGTSMNLRKFKKVATIVSNNFFHTVPGVYNVEAAYWQLVMHGTEHMCVNTASIDTGAEGYGFTKAQNDPYGSHPWNLKMLSQNDGNVLRALGPVLGLTVPTLHLGMVFSTSCWHRDPHAMPWIEYMHEGPAKVWYGIPDEQSDNFRKAVETMCPTLCQNKSLWLSSDIAMIPPALLRDHNITLSRLIQHPREYVLVFPKAYSCSISIGYTVSESVYFANRTWLEGVMQVFQEAKDSCEPTMFSLEQLLIAIVQEGNASVATLSAIYPYIEKIIADEIANREILEGIGLRIVDESQESQRRRRSETFNVRDLDECGICRSTLYLSKVRALRNTTVCLQHAIELNEKTKKLENDPDNSDVVLSFSDNDLKLISDSIKEQLHMDVYVNE